MENAESPDPPVPAPAPPLDAIEARIIGCLIEKAALTPETYPLTLNALVAACNQKTSREPVTNFEPGAIGHALRVLEQRGLVKVAASSQRALRYEHRFDALYDVTARQRGVLCMLLLRGPQTLNELLTRTDRIAAFPTVDDVRDTLDRLIQRSPAFVVRLPRVTGQREDRYMHLLGGPIDVEQLAAAHASAPAPASTRAESSERIERLEAEVRDLRDAVEALAARLDAAGA